jgi:hypothetical protein
MRLFKPITGGQINAVYWATIIQTVYKLTGWLIGIKGPFFASSGLLILVLQ